MTHIQGEDRLGKLLFQVLLQALGTVQHNLHGLGRVRAKTTLGRFRTRPPRRRLATGERAIEFFVDRAVQLAIRTPPQRVHHDDDRFLAILALVPSFPAFLAAAGLTFDAAAMPLTTTSAGSLVL